MGNNAKQSKLLQTLIMSLMIILCMSFPVKFGPDFLFDLRHIPFILGALYIGYPAAITAFIVILSYRYFIGGDGVYVNFWVITSIAVFVPLLKDFYSNLKMRSKCFFAAGLALLSGYSLVTLIIVAGGIPFNSFSQLALSFILVQVLGMLLVTYLVEQTRHNKRLKNQVIHQEKLSIINDLSTSFSKEIGTPFTLTKGFLQQLYQENLPPEQKREYIDAALKELQRGEAMTSDFLSLTKNNFEQQVYMDVDRVLHDVVNVISPYADTHSVRIKVETTILDEVWVEGEYQSFQQSLLNLVKNSIEAMPGGGELMIRTAVKSEKVIIEITDTGMGMTKEEVEKLGTPYYTTKEDGTGLGTSIAFSTIKGMRGTIEINSIKGKGTTFTIKLPKSIEDDQKNDYAS